MNIKIQIRCQMMQFWCFLTIHARVNFSSRFLCLQTCKRLRKILRLSHLTLSCHFLCGRRCLAYIMNQAKCQRLLLFSFNYDCFWDDQNKSSKSSQQLKRLKGDNHVFPFSFQTFTFCNIFSIFHVRVKLSFLLKNENIKSAFWDFFSFPSTSTTNDA